MTTLRELLKKMSTNSVNVSASSTMLTVEGQEVPNNSLTLEMSPEFVRFVTDEEAFLEFENDDCSISEVMAAQSHLTAFARPALFWVPDGDNWVGVCLYWGQTKVIDGGGETDEGRHWFANVYTHQGNSILLEQTGGEVDCDGKIEHFADYICEVTNLGRNIVAGVPLPEWQKFRASQRDHSAEAAGY